jgi:HEAT repeat protein
MADCKEILKLLQSDDSEVLREGAFLAGDERCGDAVPLLAGLLAHGHLGVQEAADGALRRIGGRAAVQAVIPHLRSDEAPARNLAMDILREIGAQDFPSLVSLLHDPDSDIRIYASDILGSTKSPLAVEPLCEALLKDPEVNVRYQAAVSLGSLGDPEAARCLNKALDDEEWVQYSVIEALAKLKHASSVNALVKALDRSSDLVASMIIDALGELGNVKAVTLLLKRMEDAPTALRNKIVKAVIRILGGKSLALLPKDERENFREYLLAALGDEDEEVQDAAIQGLSFSGGEEVSAGVLAIAAKLDPDRSQDRLAQTVQALARIGLTESLRYALLGEDQDRARVAVEALKSADDAKVPAVLMDAFWKKGRDLQRLIIAALADVAGSDCRDFFLDVLERHTDGKVLKSVLRFLGQRKLTQAGELVFALLDHKYDDVKEAALDACVAINGEDMLRRFRELYENPEPVKRLMAVYAIGKLAPAESMDLLKRALRDEIPDIRKVAIEAVTSAPSCPDGESWVPLIVRCLSDESREVRLKVVELLGKCDPKESLPHLTQALDDPDDWVRIRALDALAALRERSVTPKIVSLLEMPNRMVVVKAIEALGSIGGIQAFRSLLEVLNSDDPEIMQAAEQAVARIQAEQEREE